MDKERFFSGNILILSFIQTYKDELMLIDRLLNAGYQTSDGAHKHAFPYSHIEKSTIHQPQAGAPFLSRKELRVVFLPVV